MYAHRGLRAWIMLKRNETQEQKNYMRTQAEEPPMPMFCELGGGDNALI